MWVRFVLPVGKTHKMGSVGSLEMGIGLLNKVEGNEKHGFSSDMVCPRNSFRPSIDLIGTNSK
jgi:hypothetical protein